MRIILASGSPRRKDILTEAGLEFEIIKSDKEEIITRTKPDEVVIELSKQKAQDVCSKVNASDDYMIIAADTVVSLDDKILCKPKDRDDAYNMILSISGRTHIVYTGVTIIASKNGNSKTVSFEAHTSVSVRNMQDGEINAYIDTDEPYDKAGAYAIQGKFAKFIDKIEGEYNNVVGFPIAKFYKVIQENFLEFDIF